MRTVPLREICAIQIGPFGSLLHREDYIRGGIPLVNPMHIVSGQIQIGESQTVSEKKAATLGSYRLQAGDVVMGRRGEMGRCAIVSDAEAGMLCGTGSLYFRPDPDELSSLFLARVLSGEPMKRRLEELAQGVTMPNLNRTMIEGLEIKLPPLAEQKRIAGILDAADALRAKRRESLAQLDTLLQSTFMEMFGDPVTNAKCLVTSLGEYLVFITSGGRGWAKYYSDKGARFIRSLDVQMNAISSEELVYVDPPDNAEAKRTRVSKDDVLLTITGSRIGRVARVPETIDGAFVSQHVAILRLDGRCHPEFLSRFLSLDSGGQAQISRLRYGQTKPGLNFEQIRSFEIPAPPLEAQLRFAAIVQSVEQQKARYRSHLAELDTLFASLQSRAFRGDL